MRYGPVFLSCNVLNSSRHPRSPVHTLERSRAGFWGADDWLLSPRSKTRNMKRWIVSMADTDARRSRSPPGIDLSLRSSRYVEQGFGNGEGLCTERDLQQVLVAHALRIANHYPPSIAPQYQAAALSLRQPYWDWAADHDLPLAAILPNLTVNSPGGPTTVGNPLSSYRFHKPPSGNGFGGALAKYAETVRCPVGGETDDPTLSDADLNLPSLALTSQTVSRPAVDLAILFPKRWRRKQQPALHSFYLLPACMLHLCDNSTRWVWTETLLMTPSHSRRSQVGGVQVEERILTPASTPSSASH